MATLERIAALFNAHLNADEPQKLSKAGEVWMSLPLYFYYGKTGQNRIDIAVVEVTVGAASEDGVTLGDDMLASLKSIIHPTTSVSNAIKMIQLALNKPVLV